MKKQIPLLILESLEKYVHLKGNNFEVVSQQDILLKVVDKDENSDFYFSVEDYKTGSVFKLLINFKPVSKSSTEASSIWIEGKTLDTYFENWTKLLMRYDSVNSFFDDPITRAFENEYFSEFEIVEEDITEPLRPKQILLLDNYLEYVESNIERFSTSQNEDEVLAIKADIAVLRFNLTSKSKEWVVRKLSKIWGKLTKQGVSFVKEFLSEAKKKAIQEGVKFIIDNGITFLNN